MNVITLIEWPPYYVAPFNCNLCNVALEIGTRCLLENFSSMDLNNRIYCLNCAHAFLSQALTEISEEMANVNGKNPVSG